MMQLSKMDSFKKIKQSVFENIIIERIIDVDKEIREICIKILVLIILFNLVLIRVKQLNPENLNLLIKKKLKLFTILPLITVSTSKLLG